jgi:hypothetical protein
VSEQVHPTVRKIAIAKARIPAANAHSTRVSPGTCEPRMLPFSVHSDVVAGCRSLTRRPSCARCGLPSRGLPSLLPR